MNTPSLSLRLTSIAASALLLTATSSIFAADQPSSGPNKLVRYRLETHIEATSSPNADIRAAQTALSSNDPAAGFALPSGTTTVLVSLSKIQNVESLTFLNSGAKGEVTVATSNAKLPNESPQWHAAGREEIAANAVRAKIGPAEAKYVRLTFNMSEPGRIAGLGVYSAPSLTMAQLDNSDGKSMVDSKDMADNKDLGDNKDIPAEGPGPAAPAEGPPPGLPQPPPFTFIPQVVPETLPTSQ